MTKRQKLIDRIKENPHKVRFAQLENLLSSFNFIKLDQRGSHVAYRHRDGRTVVIVRPHGNYKECCRSDVVKAIRILGL